jgi:putative endonuclease
VNQILKVWEKIRGRFSRPGRPIHLLRGELGEQHAKLHLQKLGLKFLAANFKADRGEIDLIFRDGDCLVFVEVKSRSSEEWRRPAAAVNARKRRLVSQTALAYLKLLNHPPVAIRFDIVEVLLVESGEPVIRHLPNSFPLARPHRYG